MVLGKIPCRVGTPTAVRKLSQQAPLPLPSFRDICSKRDQTSRAEGHHDRRIDRQDDRSHCGVETEAPPGSLSVSQSAHLVSSPALSTTSVPQHKAKLQTPRKGEPHEISRTVRCTCTFAGDNPRDRVSNPHATPSPRNTRARAHTRRESPISPWRAAPANQGPQGCCVVPPRDNVSFCLTLAPPRVSSAPLL